MKKSKLKQKLKSVSSERDYWRIKYEDLHEHHHGLFNLHRTNLSQIAAMGDIAEATNSAWRTQVHKVINENEDVDKQNEELRSHMADLAIWFLDGMTDSDFMPWCEYHGIDPDDLLYDDTLNYHRFDTPNYSGMIGAYLLRKFHLEKENRQP